MAPLRSRQYSARVASAPGRGFVVVWASLDNGIDQDIRGRLFASNGEPVGDDFLVNEYTTGNQGDSDVAMGDDGSFVVVWQSSGEPGTDGLGIQARRFDSSATPVAGQFLVNSYTTGVQNHPTVGALASGGFVVAWESDGSTGDDSSFASIQWQRFDSDGSSVGSQFQVNTYTTGTQRDPAVALGGSGDLLISWLSNPTGGISDKAIRARRFGSDGVALGSEIQVSDPALISTHQLAVDESGAFSVAWDQTDVGTFINSAFIRLFDASDTALGPAEAVSVDTGAGHSLPSVAYGAEDDLAVAWTALTDEGLAQTRVRRFSTAGEAVGAEFVANSFSNEYQYAPSLAQSDEGSFVVVWESGSSPQDDSGYSILARRFGVERVTGLAWNDVDGDGRQDGSEPRMAGVDVRILDLDGTEQSMTTTDANGLYRLPGPPPGPHYVQMGAPAGYVFTAQDQGPSDELDSDVDPVNGDTPAFDFDLGLHFEWDAGLVSDTGSLGDRVWLDDGNGIQDGGEIGMVGVVVNLYNPLGSLQATTVTDMAGHYAFDAASGDYYLDFLLPPDHAFAPRDQGADDGADSDVNAASGTTSIFSLAAGGVETGWDAGLEPAVIGNRVWLDANGDGRQQPGEAGLAGITVRLLDGSDMEIAATTTGADGIYGFLGVETGTYRIEVVPPTDGVFSSPDVGGDDLIDSDVDQATGRSPLFSYQAASANRGWDAGLTILPLFADGFESGDLSAWTSSSP